ncbi:MAG: efflux RND transporter periplasmic adaptor subunit [Rhodoferax sp.]|uniref:efflux RND transporter periplasmic adaptor subunit n=1 Tax=Rhodoferax sp. TaxID=50421 RepID=UPI00326397D3
MTEPRPADRDTAEVNAAVTDPAQHRRTVRRTQIAALVVLVLLALGAGRTVFSRMANARSLESSTAEQAKQYVKVTLPKRSQAGQTLVLPGTLQGFVQSPIAARSSGYLKRWTKDIGSKVAKGELLADIESPEIDQQLTQSMAAREQAASSLALAQSTVERWESLRKKDVVSQQDLDEKRSAVAQQHANLAAADANVQRLRQLEGFKHVVAPFAGVITRRNVDVGDLIDSNKVLFMLSQTDPLRVYINVPQAYAQLVKAGEPVVVTQAELRGQSFKGQIARTSASIDTSTRTMQVEVALPNRDGTLLPGAYVQVALPLQASQSLTVPTNALLFRGTGTMVGVVDAQGKVTLHRVSVGRNYGDAFEALDGIADTDRIVLNPPDWLADGQTVTVAAAPATAAAPASAASKAAL